MNNKYYMKKALNYAEKGIGFVSPNPPVGALVVKDDKIIGAGYHEKFGSNHAEINAFAKTKKDTRESTLFVTLEPCCHYGKTPPCTDAIIRSGIKKVVIGMEDPNPVVKGNGINILKKNGIVVDVENLNGNVDVFYESFKKYITSKIPFITLKMAMTLDGKIAAVTGDSKWISNDKSRKLVHKYRRKNDAVLVGIETIVRDDPKLTPYLIKSIAPMPLRIILDPHLRIPESSTVIKDGNPTLIVCSETISHSRTFSDFPNVKVLPLKTDGNKFDLALLSSLLGKQGITSILIEGGSSTSASFFEQKLIDKIIFFIAPKILGGKQAPTPVGGNGIKKIIDAINVKNLTIKNIDSDILVTGYPVYDMSSES